MPGLCFCYLRAPRRPPRPVSVHFSLALNIAREAIAARAPSRARGLTNELRGCRPANTLTLLTSMVDFCPQSSKLHVAVSGITRPRLGRLAHVFPFYCASAGASPGRRCESCVCSRTVVFELSCAVWNGTRRLQPCNQRRPAWVLCSGTDSRSSLVNHKRWGKRAPWPAQARALLMVALFCTFPGSQMGPCSTAGFVAPGTARCAVANICGCYVWRTARCRAHLADFAHHSATQAT